ncbi:MAG: HEAT repeat domain-containing protein [Chloroflexota bacterium]
MTELSENPTGRPEIEFQEVVDALLEQDTPFPARLLYRFSDLHGEDLTRLTALWPELTPERREGLLEDLELLSESNYLVSFEAVSMLGLSDPLSRVRQLAIRSLWESETPELISLFIEIMENDSNLETRAQAARGLGKFVFLAELEEISESRGAEVVEKLLETNEEPFPMRLRCAALEALGYGSLPEVTELIEQAYQRDNDEWMISALIAMGRSANPQWIPMVIEHIDHSDNLVRLRAVQAAGELSAGKAVGHLVEHLQDPDDEVRMAAVWALSEIGGDEARRAIESMLEETEDEDELDLIEDALENIEFSNMSDDFNLLDLEEEDLEDMIRPEEDEDSAA